MHKLVILTGASGAGKTALVDYISSQAAGQSSVTFLNFDTIGVPSLEEMIADFGSPEAWQRCKTREWMHKIKNDYLPYSPVLFEGQMRMSFIKEALAASGLNHSTSLLLDCDDATRAYRLTKLRQQAELANADMMNWAAYLRREAIEAGFTVLDTSQQTLAQTAQQVLACFR